MLTPGMRRRAAAFAIGTAIVATAVSPAVDRLADARFAFHMVQHLLLMTVAPPFLVFGAPHLWAPRLVPAVRGALAAVGHSTQLRRAWRWSSAPLTAVMLHAIAVWSWHSPALFDAALEHDALHVTEHLCLLGTGALVWWSILLPRRDRRAAYGVGVVSLFLTSMQSGILGALFVLSPRALYSTDAGPVSLGDQQLGGAIMWAVGGGLYLTAAGVLFVAWLAPRAGVTPRPTPLLLLPPNAESAAATCPPARCQHSTPL